MIILTNYGTDLEMETQNTDSGQALVSSQIHSFLKELDILMDFSFI